MRVLLVVILPFLLPALAYFGWWWWRRRAAVAAGRPEDAPGLGDAPVTALVAVGVGLGIKSSLHRRLVRLVWWLLTKEKATKANLRP